MPFGVGGAVTITTSATLGKALVVTFTYGDEIVDTTQLGLAAQASDGSWYALPTNPVDPSSNTVTAFLPDVLDPTRGTGRSYTVTRWVKDEYALEPTPVTLRVNQSVTLTPYAFAYANTCSDDPEPGLLSQPGCKLSEVPFTNDKPGFTRVWYVNNSIEGDATVGTIKPLTIGATYTAPAQVPDPSTVVVEFISLDTSSARMAAAIAHVTIIDAGDSFTGTITGPFDAENNYTGTVQLKQILLDDPLYDQFQYSGIGTVPPYSNTVTLPASLKEGQDTCTADPASGPLEIVDHSASLSINLPANSFEPNTYILSWSFSFPTTLTCTRPNGVTYTFMTLAYGDVDSTMDCAGPTIFQPISNPAHLQGSVTCPTDPNNSGSWDLTRQQPGN